MATWVNRAQAIIEGANDVLPPAEQQQRIADAFVIYAPDIAQAVIDARPLINSPEEPDTSALTNEEKAQIFVLSLKRWGQSVLRATAEKGARDDNESNVTAAGDAAASDL